MMPDNDFQIIYSNDDAQERDKYWLYTALLEFNDAFIKDVDSLRRKYGIVIDITANTINAHDSLLENKDFMGDVQKIAKKIKLQGNWLNGLAMYVCGYPPQEVLGPDDILHKVSARAVNDSDNPYLEIRIYGDIPTQELNEAVKAVRDFMKANMKYESVNASLDQDALLNSMLFKQLSKGMSAKNANNKMVEDFDNESVEYSNLRRRLADYKKYAERLY